MLMISDDHTCHSDLESLIQRLGHDSILAIKSFESTYMKLNNDKCHLLAISMKWCGQILAKSKYGKARNKIGRNMKLDEYKKREKKLCALER